MKVITISISVFFLLSCSTTPENINGFNIAGKWTECRDISPEDIAYTEVNFTNSGRSSERIVFGSMDNQCINIYPEPVFRTNATVVLENPHLSASGLTVYDYTLVNVNRWENFSKTTFSQPNFYSIVYLDGDRLYSGKLTETLDGTSEETRPDEINFSIFLTKQ